MSKELPQYPKEKRKKKKEDKKKIKNKKRYERQEKKEKKMQKSIRQMPRYNHGCRLLQMNGPQQPSVSSSSLTSFGYMQKNKNTY